MSSSEALKSSTSFWSEIIGQDQALATIKRALAGVGTSEMSHAWLITGPPGSGRSNLAYRFAAALIAGSEEEQDRVYKQVKAKTHPDLEVLSTEGSIIKIEHARDIAMRAHYAPSQGRFRVIVAEDADRLPEKSSNTLLKSLEEPPPGTVWLLCAPSEADMLPTIRSRTRLLRLKTPSQQAVAELLHTRDSVDIETAKTAARLSQNHVGMARTLAGDGAALERRMSVLRETLSVDNLSDAMFTATTILKLAEADAKAMTAERDEAERREALRSMGLTEGAAIPRPLRAQLKALEQDQVRRAKRSLVDALDRVFVDITSMFRDALVISLGGGVGLVNEEFRSEIERLCTEVSTEKILIMVDHVEKARFRLSRAITPALTLEALFASIVSLRNER